MFLTEDYPLIRNARRLASPRGTAVAREGPNSLLKGWFMLVRGVSGSDARVDTCRVEQQPSARELEARLKDAEQRAYEAEAAYETLLEQVPAAIYVWAPEMGGPTLSMSSYVAGAPRGARGTVPRR